MSQHTQVYQVARIGAVVGAGLYTGLALSAPLYSLPTISSFSASKSAKTKSYQTKSNKLSPSDRLTLFSTVHHTTGAVAIPVAVVSGALYAIAAYFAPPGVAYSPSYLARGAGEIGSRYPTDSFLSRFTSSRSLLIGASLALFSVLPISTFISNKSAQGALNLEPRLIADAAIPSSYGTDSEKQLDKQLAKWNSGVQLASFVGLLATIAGALQLTGHGAHHTIL